MQNNKFNSEIAELFTCFAQAFVRVVCDVDAGLGVRPTRLQVYTQVDAFALSTEEARRAITIIQTILAIAETSVQTGAEVTGLVEFTVGAHEPLPTGTRVCRCARVQTLAAVLTRLREAGVEVFTVRSVVSQAAGAREERPSDVVTHSAMLAGSARTGIELLTTFSEKAISTLALVFRLRRVDTHGVVAARDVIARVDKLAPVTVKSLPTLATTPTQVGHENTVVETKPQDVALVVAVRIDDVSVAPASPILIAQDDVTRAHSAIVYDVTT